MKKILKKIPIPIAGLMLGLAGLGNIVAPYYGGLRYTAGAISIFIGLLLTAKFITNNKMFKTELKNPIKASVLLTFPMGIIILSTYLIPISKQFGQYIWFGGIILHIILLFNFTRKFIFNFDIEKVYPSFFIVYVGIVVSSVTAPAFDQFQLGRSIFWFGFLSYLVLLPIVSYRVFKVKKIKDIALPTITIFTAPAGLCLAGYMNTFLVKNTYLLGCLITLTLISITAVMLYLPKMLSIDFCPSYSAFTFPFVITTIGLKSASVYLIEGFGVYALKTPVQFIEYLTIALVIYVLVKYTFHLINELNINSVFKRGYKTNN
jgi:exfoliative toxin A/B